MPLTREQLAAAMPGLARRPKLLDAYLPHLLAALREFDITTERRVEAFLAQMGHESSDFTRLVENMNYSAKRLRQVFPKYFTEAQAAEFAGKPREIANRVYGSRLGNRPGTDDGWNFRGNGIIHLTGRENHRKAGEALGVDFEARPELAREPEHMFRVAGWFWKTKGLNALADRNDFEGITRRINGGLNGYSDRLARWARAKKAVTPETPAPRALADVSPPEAPPVQAPVIVAPVAAVTPVPVEGGAPEDPAVKANKQSLIQKLISWVTGGTIVSAVTDKLGSLTGLSPETQLFIVKGLFYAGILAALVAAFDHFQTKWSKSRPDRLNVK